MIHVINYANHSYKKAQRFNSCTAKKMGADVIHSFSEADIDDCFYKKNKSILEQPRGNGYWLWKPYFINKIIEIAQDNDWIVYCDSGLYFNKSIPDYIAALEKRMGKAYIAAKQLSFNESAYAKGDVFDALNCRFPEVAQTKQFAAGVLVIRVNSISREIINKWLEFAQNEQLISDSPSASENYADFVENRHDQSIASLLFKKYQCIYAEEDLFHDILRIWKYSKALCIYHHSRGGNYIEILFASVLRMMKILKNKIKK